MTQLPLASEGARFVRERRTAKHLLDPHRAYGEFVEEEPDNLRGIFSVVTLLLTNRECPWKCVFCDLWTNTLDETVPLGAIPGQIRAALADLPPARWIKLYNAGSFFDPRAIPPADIPVIADLLAPFERVIVESHPALIGGGAASAVLHFRNCLHSHSSGPSGSSESQGTENVHRSAEHARPIRPTNICEPPPPIAPGHVVESLRSTGLTRSVGAQRSSDATSRSSSAADRQSSQSDDASGNSSFTLPRLTPPRLEVAMGLETVHPFALERLNKGMTLDDFARAADVLRRSDIDLRAFVLVQPPFTPPEESVHWALRSLDFAHDHGARFVAFIPTRGGNGAMQALGAAGEFVPPRLSTLEDTLDRALESASSHGGPVVAADLWDLERFSDCPACFPARAARLRRMNLSQAVEPRIACDCASSQASGSSTSGEVTS